MLEFVECINCGKTMPKQITGNEFLDNLVPDKVWCSEICFQEYNDNSGDKNDRLYL